VEVQWNNIKKYVLGTVSDLLGDSRGEQERINEIDEHRKCKNVNH
jgi:hypothetical protein